MATQTRTRPQRPARTIVGNTVTEQPAEMPVVSIERSEIKAAVEIENGQATGVALFLPAPVEIPTEGYVKRFNNIDCRLTEDGHKNAFQKLYYCLNQTHTQLASGKHIDTPADVVKYLLEQFTFAIAGS